MMDEQEEERIQEIRDVIGEHFTTFAFVVITEDGDLFYDYKDRFTGRALMSEAVEDMDAPMGEMLEIDWEDDDNEGEEWKNE